MSSVVLEFKDQKAVPDAYCKYTADIKDTRIPLVIDNGSYQSRVGWATSSGPLLIFKNLIAKPRKERTKKDGDPPSTPPIQIGNDIVNIEAVRFQLKTQFDKNVVTHFEAQEQVFDYIFTHLGIDTEGNVHHPIVLTEAFLNPNYCRQLMSEMLFECYGVPSISYGVDSLLSFYHNNIGHTGIIINCGYHTTHIIPILRGGVISSQARRINLGGFQMISYLHRLLQLKYPVHSNAITPSRAEELLQDHCFIACHYIEELQKWTDQEHYDFHVRKVQLPYVQQATNPNISVEAQKERKREMAKRLLEINARKREEKLAEDEEQLNQLLAIQDMLDDGEEDEFIRALKSCDIKNYDELQRQIAQLNCRMEKMKQKIVAAATEGEIEEKIVKPKGIQPPSDSYQFEIWLADLRKKHSEIGRTRMLRRQRRADMARRRTAAAQERMRLISRLAAPGAKPNQTQRDRDDDDFGARDEDWDIYKTISRDANDSDSDADNERMIEIEEVLREHDPLFGNGNADSDIGISEAHQLHVGIERMRAPELLFQPSMIGNIEAGLAETIEFMLKRFSSEDQLALANNVFLTGGFAHFPGLVERLSRELLEMRPFKTTHKVVLARDPSMDAWNGARDLASNPLLPDYSISRQDYMELGGEFLREHYSSNKYYKSPAPLDISNLGPAGDANVIKEEIIDIM